MPSHGYRGRPPGHGGAVPSLSRSDRPWRTSGPGRGSTAGGPPSPEYPLPWVPSAPPGHPTGSAEADRPRRGEGAGTPKKGPRTPSGGILGRPRKKGQKWPFLGPLRRKVQGEWGGSAHSPDPTAQSVVMFAERPPPPRTPRVCPPARLGTWGGAWRGLVGAVVTGHIGLDRAQGPTHPHLSRGSGKLTSDGPRARTICSDVPA